MCSNLTLCFPDPLEEFTHYPNQAHPGQDIKTLTDVSPRVCAKECLDTDECNAYDFVTDGGNNNCSLKNVIEDVDLIISETSVDHFRKKGQFLFTNNCMILAKKSSPKSTNVFGKQCWSLILVKNNLAGK